jgi:hypothetical protein
MSTSVAAARIAAGLVEFAGPDRPWLTRLWDRPLDDRVRLASRILAARDLATAAVLTRERSRGFRRALVAVDSLHAVSMIGLALVSHRYRRPALLSFVMATTLALTTAADSSQH